MKKTIYIGQMEEVFGYGLSVVANSKKECEDTMFKTYGKLYKRNLYKWEKEWEKQPTKKHFLKRLEDWSGHISKVKLNHSYFGNFKEQWKL